MPVLTLILFTSLLWPTFFMGVSLPLLARAVTSRLDRAAATVGALYACNTLGAAVGAFLTTWWILPAAGLDRSLHVGALLNVGCAAIVVPFARRLSGPRRRRALSGAWLADRTDRQRRCHSGCGRQSTRCRG